MASHFDDFVRQSLVGVKSKRFGTWKKRWLLLRRYSSSGPPRIEEFTERQALHRLTDSSSVHPTHIWPLIDVVGVTQGNSRPNPRKRKVTICFANGSVDQFKFRTNTAQEAEQWCRDIEEVSSMVYADIRFNDDTAAVQTECFRVFLQPSPLLRVSGECHMEVTSTHVIVTDLLHDSRVVTWDIDTIRRFGSDGRQLSIETGRSSRTGEGYFEFQSFEAQKIERHLNAVTFALSTAVHVIETDANRGGAPVVPSRPSQHRMQWQRHLQQSIEASGGYMQHARSEPGSSAGLFAFADSPEAYRRPSAPTPYPRSTRIHSPPVADLNDVFPMYFAAAAPAAAAAEDRVRRPSTPVDFFRNRSPPLSAPPFRFSRVDSDESTSDLESPPVLPERSHQRHLASSKNLSLSQTQELNFCLESPHRPMLSERLQNRRQPTTSPQNLFRPQQQQQQQQQQRHQQSRTPEVTPIPSVLTRGAFISTSSCPPPSSPSYTHFSVQLPPLPPRLPPPPRRAAYNLPPPPSPPPPLPPRLAFRSTSSFNNTNDV